MGPSEVAKVSQYDEARVPLGIKEATLQAPLLIHIWVTLYGYLIMIELSQIATSLFLRCIRGNEDAVTYSGPTYAAVRSGKYRINRQHTALLESRNFEHMYVHPLQFVIQS